MSRVRVVALVIAVVLALGAVSYVVLKRIDADARAVENGVVEFKKGNYEDGLRILAPYADRGNQAAQLNVGLAYAFGQGTRIDREKARQLLRASLGDKASEMYLWVAKSFESGDQVAKSPEEATAWYRIAAAEGSTEAQEWLRRLASPNGAREL
jgi:TPR repeat protein